MLKAAAAAALLGAAFLAAQPATAGTTINIGQYYSNPDVPYYTVTQTFTLSSVTNAKINLSNFYADDAAVLEVNGTPLFGTGIFGPGNGYFYFTAAGPSTPYYFAYTDDVNASFSAPFVVGSNTITYIVNNNYAGINSGNGPLTGGPSLLYVAGTVTVPEPATWGLMLGGLALVGTALRRRSTSVVAA